VKRYEQSVRVITAFYAVLLGFGLKNLLDGKLVGEWHWVLLIIASLFFLRFLTGSVNHLWVKYVSPAAPSPICAAWFPFDVGLLMLFGVIGLVICYADTLDTFLWWNFGLGVLATAGAAVYWARDEAESPGQSWGVFWAPINAAQAGLTLLFLCLHQALAMSSQGSPPFVGFVLWGLAVVYFGALLLDLYFQLRVLACVAER
jgi:hypothetical protein